VPVDRFPSPNRVVALAVGFAYLVFGGLSFGATVGLGFFDPEGFWLADVLAVNSAQNSLHLAIGAALIAFAFTRWSARANAIVGTALLAVGLAGLFLIATPANVIAVNGAANLLHFATSAGLLVVGLGADPAARRSEAVKR
jgi:hypothetical protein